MPVPKLLKSFMLDLEWADGQKARITGENLKAEFEVGPAPEVAGDLQPELVVDVVHLVQNTRYELVLRLQQRSSDSRLEVWRP